MNTQSIEKRRLDTDGIVQVHSVFHTIQGEGPFTGHPSVFIRLAGCNLQCPACDTDYTSSRWTASPETLLEYVAKQREAPALVVITGGEPFRQNIHALVATLLRAGYTVQIETNGTLPPPSIGFFELCSVNIAERNKCFVVCSPKTGLVNRELIPLIAAYKYVLAHDSVHEDGLPLRALDHTASPHVARPHEGFNGPVYLQPCDSKDATVNAANLHATINSVMTNGFTLQLQVHKLIEME